MSTTPFLINVDDDPDTGAWYVHLGEGAVVTTVSVSDSVMVDLDRYGRVVGLESLIPPAGRPWWQDVTYAVNGTANVARFTPEEPS